jgi:regulatory protein
VALVGRVAAVYYFKSVKYTITALKFQKSNRQRVNVYLDGKYAFGLAHIAAAWLKEGLEIDDKKITKLLQEDEQEKAYQRALNYLSYRPRTEIEIHKKLKDYGVPEITITSVIKRLVENDLIDDKSFALSWIENRSDLRPRSRRMLSYELHQRGINQQIINQTLEQINDQELAYRAATTQAHKYKALEKIRFRKKMAGFLARRGFNYDVISEVLPMVWNELKIDNEDN